MTLPKKRRRNIVVDSQPFHWVDNYLTKHNGTTAIQSASGIGPLIKGIVWGRLTPSDVEGCIRFAKAQGWNPASGHGIEIFINTDDSPTTFSSLPDFKNAESRKLWIEVAVKLELTRIILGYEIKNLNFDDYRDSLFRNELASAAEALMRCGKQSRSIRFWQCLLNAIKKLSLCDLIKPIQAKITHLETNSS